MSGLYPFHSESERNWFAWAGLYVSSWSAAEATIQRLIDFLYRFRDASSIEENPPLNLDRQIKFLRRAAKQIPALETERDEILAMADALAVESELRHLIIHGQNQNFLKADPHFLLLAKPKKRSQPNGEKHQLVVSQEKIQTGYDAIGFLSLCFIGCTHRLMSDLEAEIEAKERTLKT